MRTGAVVVNWNTPSLTIRSVESLLADGLKPQQVVIVDNCSTDDSCVQFTRQLPKVRVIRSECNAGYARASNVGAATFQDTETLIFVNSDAAVFRHDSISALQAAVNQPGVGITVPRLLNEDLTLQPSVVPFRTPTATFLEVTTLGRFLPNDSQPRWGMYWDHRRSGTIRSATGAVMAVRREAWTALGGFFEGAHMFAEDHDLCWRASDLGWKTWFTNEAEFVHTGGASTRTAFGAAERSLDVARAEGALIRRQLDPTQAALTLRLLKFGSGVRWGLSAIRGDQSLAAEHAASFHGFSACTQDYQPPRSTCTERRLLSARSPSTSGAPRHSG